MKSFLVSISLLCLILLSALRGHAILLSDIVAGTVPEGGGIRYENFGVFDLGPGEGVSADELDLSLIPGGIRLSGPMFKDPEPSGTIDSRLAYDVVASTPVQTITKRCDCVGDGGDFGDLFELGASGPFTQVAGFNVTATNQEMSFFLGGALGAF